jgi:hypothetical protein
MIAAPEHAPNKNDMSLFNRIIFEHELDVFSAEGN